jgi:predicted transcriptional regulator
VIIGAELPATERPQKPTEQPFAPALWGRSAIPVPAAPAPTAAPEVAIKKDPAVPIKKSLTPDFIICLQDGKKFQSLKRHLRTAYSLTPEEYLAKWGLPSDYPMVAPNYSQRRSQLAMSMGLGKKQPKAVKARTKRSAS